MSYHTWIKDYDFVLLIKEVRVQLDLSQEDIGHCKPVGEGRFLPSKMAELKKGWPVVTMIVAAKCFKVSEEEFEKKDNSIKGWRKHQNTLYRYITGFRKVHARQKDQKNSL